MKQLCARLLVIAAFGSLLASAGCVLSESDLVITDQVCVNIDEVQTTGSFSTFVVADEFKEQLEKKLAENGKSPKDVKSIHMLSASFKSVKVQPHDWIVDADIDIQRQDTDGGPITDGPAPLVSFDNQSLQALKGAPNVPTLAAAGVELVDRALASLLTGEDPRLVLVVNNESVTPTPSASDAMAFTTTACVKFQVVVSNSKAGGKK
jgi:hypothetical protein